MKKIRLALLILVILTESCNKQKHDDTVTMQVMEYKSQIPIGDVTVSFYNTKLIIGSGFPYFDQELFKQGITDANGNYTFTRKELEKADGGIVLTKTKYWKGMEGEGKQYMSPEAYLTLHLLKTNIYPSHYFMTLSAEGEHSKSGILSFQIPVDSTISLRAFGNETSTYSWFISGIPLTCSNPPCFIDTSGRGEFQVNIDKGLTSSYTLRY